MYVMIVMNITIKLCSSLWLGHVDLHWFGDRHARHFGTEMRGGRVDRPPDLTGPVHLPANAFPLRQLSSRRRTIRSFRPFRIHAFGGHQLGLMDQDHYLGVRQ